MPFEIAPKEQTLAHKLAALIEAGRVANPDVRHGAGAFVRDGKACAMGYALLAMGINVEGQCYDRLAKALEVDRTELQIIADRVVSMNDHKRASISEITEAL